MADSDFQPDEEAGGDQTEQPNILDMSDEDFLSNGDNLLDTIDDVDPKEDEEVVYTEDDEDSDGEEEEPEAEDGDSDVTEADSSDQQESDESDPDGDDSDVADDTGSDSGGDTEGDDNDSPVDYKAVYDSLTAPFKANGKTMSVENVEDARQLMQMGANYNKKMAGLKPVMALVKMLEKNNLADEGKLSFLIDVAQKDPAAIAKLLKDSNIDPHDMNVDEDAEEYKAKDHSVDTREIDLDEVISQIKDDPHFNQSVDVVDKWDEASKQAVANDPTLLTAIHSQISNGIYEKVSTVVASERVFGRLQGLSDIQAYQTVGQQLAQTGAFNDILEPQGGQNGDENTGTGKTESSKRNDQKRRDKRRAASPTRKSSSKKKKPAEGNFNPLAMSDDEFMKQGDAKYL